MEGSLAATAIGLLTGVLVGFAGLGGGSVLIPLLILVLRVPPLEAVGSAAVFATLTKGVAAILHWRQGTIDLRLGLQLAAGSVPGALLGVALLAYLWESRGSTEVNEFLGTVIGVLLLLLPLIVLLQSRSGASLARGRTWAAGDAGARGDALQTGPSAFRRERYRALLVGVAGGVLIGLTSIGAGVVILPLLLLLFPRPPAVLVGTDIIQAVLVTGVAGLAHLELGTVDIPLVLALLAGALPGTYLGARLTAVVPTLWLRAALLILLAAAGASML